MKIIDAHTHVIPKYAAMAVEVMDLCGIESVVTLEWHDGFGESLQRHMEIFNSYEGRFTVFGNVNWSRVNEQNFGDTAAAQIEEGVMLGMKGVKIYKSLGLEYRKSDGDFWRINDTAFDPLWARAGELGIPVMIHSADPVAFWQPIDENNFYNAVLVGDYAQWSYYQKDVPGYEQLLSDRNEVIARHPGTTFICPHVGSRSHDVERAAQDLDMLPNLYYDISARIPMLSRFREHAQHAREFIIKYQDRILLGTDIIYDDINVPTGIQAQGLYQPGEIPLNGEDHLRKYVRTTVDFFQSHIDFLATDKIQKNPPFKRNRQGFSIFGIELPSAVLSQVLHDNASSIILKG